MLSLFLGQKLFTAEDAVDNNYEDDNIANESLAFSYAQES